MAPIGCVIIRQEFALIWGRCLQRFLERSLLLTETAGYSSVNMQVSQKSAKIGKDWMLYRQSTYFFVVDVTILVSPPGSREVLACNS
jgi:hypothetical protein